MKIKTVYLHNLRNSEHSELIRRIVEIIGRSGASELRVEAQLAAMTDALACEDEILVRISQSILTKRIKEADRERDDQAWERAPDRLGGCCTEAGIIVHSWQSAIRRCVHDVRRAEIRCCGDFW